MSLQRLEKRRIFYGGGAISRRKIKGAKRRVGALKFTPDGGRKRGTSLILTGNIF